MSVLPFLETGGWLTTLVAVSATVVGYIFLYQVLGLRIRGAAPTGAWRRLHAMRLQIGHESGEGRSQGAGFEAELHDALHASPPDGPARYEAGAEPAREMWLPGVEWPASWPPEGERPSPPHP